MKQIVLNNKSYFDYDEFKKYKLEIEKIKSKNYELILMPPMVYLSLCKTSKIKIGAQNFYSYIKGSFTGETNLEALKSMNINTVLVGHFERKSIGLEPYSMIKEKLFKSLNAKFETILCVGEFKQKDNALKYIKKELDYVLKHVEEDNFKYLTIAYEPGWAIGGDETLSIKKIEKITSFIKKYVNKKYNVDIKVLYGGSVNKETAKDIIDVTDGILIGKMSTNAEKIKELIKEID